MRFLDYFCAGPKKRVASPIPEPVTIKVEPKDDGGYEKKSSSFPNLATAGQPGKGIMQRYHAARYIWFNLCP